MKPTAVLALFWILLASDAAVHAQDFQNLDFEQAMPVLTGSFDDRSQDSADVLPHWLVEAFDSGFPTISVAYNSFGHIGTDPPIIHVFGGDGVSTDNLPDHQYRAVAGNYSAMLEPRATWISLQQTGLIPAGARSLRFSGKVDDEQFPPAFYFPYVEVSLNGVVLPIYELGPVVGDTYRTGLYGIGQAFQYGVNIPPGLAGTTATLKFYSADDDARLTLDDIHFSPVGIPEPASLGMGGVALLALTRSRQRRQKHQKKEPGQASARPGSFVKRRNSPAAAFKVAHP